MTPRSPLLNAAEAMAYLRKGRTWLTEHADEIGCVRDGGRLYFFEADLTRYLDQHYQRPALAPVQAPRRVASMAPGPERINPVSRRPYGSAAR